MNIRRYAVIKEDDVGLLTARVTDMISNGWVIVGGIAAGSELTVAPDRTMPSGQVLKGELFERVLRPFFCQALVLPRDPNEPQVVAKVRRS